MINYSTLAVREEVPEVVGYQAEPSTESYLQQSSSEEAFLAPSHSAFTPIAGCIAGEVGLGLVLFEGWSKEVLGVSAGLLMIGGVVKAVKSLRKPGMAVSDLKQTYQLELPK